MLVSYTIIDNMLNLELFYNFLVYILTFLGLIEFFSKR